MDQSVLLWYKASQWDGASEAVDQSVLLWFKTSQWNGASKAGSSGHPTLQNGDAGQGERSFWTDNTLVSTSFTDAWL